MKQKDRTIAEVSRAQAVIMVNGAMWSALEIIGISRRQAFYWRTQFLEHGVDVLAEKRSNNRPQLLNTEQRATVKQWLEYSLPKDHGYPGTIFWTTGILANLIFHRFGIKYRSKTSYYLIFKHASFSVHKPQKRYEKANEAVVAAWIKQVEPVLQQAWQDNDTVILCEDEMLLTTTTTIQKVWLPEGEYPPVLETNRSRKNKSIYGFLDLKTGEQHAFKTERQTMYDTVRVLRRLKRLYPGKHILLLWDGAGWHRGREVQKYLKRTGTIAEYYFPPYSPELNPQEHVWKAGRSAITHNRFIDNLDKATDELVAYLNSLRFTYKLLGFSAG